MKKAVVMVSAVVLASVMMCMAEKAAPKEVTVAGVVKVTKSDDGKVTAVQIGEVAVKLDEKAKAVEALDGKKVEAKGTVAEADGAKVLTVTAVKEAAAEEAPEAAAE